MGPNGGLAPFGSTLYPPVQPSGTKGRNGTLTPAPIGRENAAGGAVQAPPADVRSPGKDYFITTERLTVNVSSAPGLTTTW